MADQQSLTEEQAVYVAEQVTKWIAAGDVIEEHRDLCIHATGRFYLMLRVLGKDITLQQSCRDYHVALKAQETMDPREIARIKRYLNQARKELR